MAHEGDLLLGALPCSPLPALPLCSSISPVLNLLTVILSSCLNLSY